MRYANNSQYKAHETDSQIRKEVYCNQIILDELKRIVETSEVLNLDMDKIKKWPEPNAVGKQELVIELNDTKGKRRKMRIVTCKFGSFVDFKKTSDPDGLTVFHYLLQDVKCMVFSLINMHFRLKPV